MSQEHDYPIWHRLPGETSSAFMAFRFYRELPPGRRSIDAAYQIYMGDQTSAKRAPGYWKEWSTKNRWVERVNAYEDHLGAVELFRQEEQVAAKAQLWAERLELEREEMYQVRSKLLERARLMLEFPVEKTEVKDDGKTVIIMPGRWHFGTTAKMIETAFLLGRLSMEAQGDKAESLLAGIDLSLLTDEELARLAAGENPQIVLRRYRGLK